MPSLLSRSTSEIPAASKAIINVIVVCGTFFVLAYSVVFNDPNFPLEQGSVLDYTFALEPLLALLAIMVGVRNGWIEWTKEHYDRVHNRLSAPTGVARFDGLKEALGEVRRTRALMKFPLSGAELLTFVGFISGFCFLHQFSFPILPDASGVNWAMYAAPSFFALVGLIWTSQQDKATGGKIRIWSAIWYALMMFAIGADMFLNINMASASRAERMVLANIHSKYSTTSSKGNTHIYYVHVTSPTDSNSIVSLAIDRASWDRVRNGDVIKLRLYRGGLGQDYWQYEH